ncbi:MAG: hypothetical protein J5841_01565 [Clostridia bacterium]|nr:hypothetical protein [Clostridia bacterium]
MMIISRWENMGPEWKTEEIFRIRELLKENRIPFRMPASDLFCASVFHMPDKDKRWSILIREKDRPEAAALLIREGLADKNLLPDFAEEPCRPESAGHRTSGKEKSFPVISSESFSKKLLYVAQAAGTSSASANHSLSIRSSISSSKYGE